MKTSTLIKRLDQADDPDTVAAQELPKWNKSGGKVSNGLVRRRQSEVQLFQSGGGGGGNCCGGTGGGGGGGGSGGGGGGGSGSCSSSGSCSGSGSGSGK